MPRDWERIKQMGLPLPGNEVWTRLGSSPSPSLRPHFFSELGKDEKRGLVLSFLRSFYGQDGFPSQMVRIEVAQMMFEEGRKEFWPEEREVFGRPEDSRFIFHASIAVWLGGMRSNFCQAIPAWILGRDTGRHFPFLDCLNFVEEYNRDHRGEILPFFGSSKKGDEERGIVSFLLNSLYLELDMQGKMGKAFSASLGGCPQALWPRIQGKKILPVDWRPNSRHCPDFDEMNAHWRRAYAPWLGERILSCGELLAMADDKLEKVRPLVDNSVLRRWERLTFAWVRRPLPEG